MFLWICLVQKLRAVTDCRQTDGGSGVEVADAAAATTTTTTDFDLMIICGILVFV